MKRFWYSLFLIVVTVKVSAVGAIGFNQASIRLARISPNNSPLPILVTVESGSDNVENGLKITVGNGWSVSNLSAKVKVSTNNLPAGVTPWPGIGNHGAVSSQIINFSSEDLTSNRSYGFYITNGIGINPMAGDGANYKWKVQTISGVVTSEETEIKLPIVDSDQIAITGKVGALATDFQLDLIPKSNSVLNQDQELEYEIVYGSYLNSTVRPLKIVAEWTRGTIEDQGTPTLDIIDYVPGSSSLAHGGGVPIIDILNRRIEWTINSFPAKTDNKTVKFRLRTNSSYTGGRRVNFTVKAWLYGSDVVSINKSVINSYQYYSSITPTSIPITSGGNSSQTIPTPTPTLAPKIKKVEIIQLTDGVVTIAVGSNVDPTKVKIKYGKTMAGLNDSLTSINKLKDQEIAVDSLEPGKDYYFKVYITDDTGKVIGSELYTFKTADTLEIATVDKNTMTLAVENNVISDSKKDMSTVVAGQNCSFKFKVNKSEKVKQIQLLVRDSQVLGASTVYAMETGQLQSDLVEAEDGNYIGHIMSPEKEGVYEIIIRIVGFNGSVSEQKVGTLEVVMPLTVKTDKGVKIEGARVTLSRLNSAEVYEIISPNALGIKNPVYTDNQGKVKLTLPKGNYRVEISLVGFADKTVDFSIGMGGDNKMPQIVLEKQLGNWSKYIGFYRDSVIDLWQLTKEFSNQLVISIIFFRVTMILQVMLGGIIWWCFYKNKKEVEEKTDSIWRRGIKKFIFSVILAVLIIFLGLDLLFGLKFGMVAIILILLAIINLGLFISLVNI